MKILKLSLLLFFAVIGSGCQSNNGPTITHVVIKNDLKGIILDTRDRNILDAFEKNFYNKKEYPQGDPTFEYLMDISSGDKSTRWQYNPDGKIRIFQPNSKIYKIENVSSFNKTLTINPNPNIRKHDSSITP